MENDPAAKFFACLRLSIENDSFALLRLRSPGEPQSEARLVGLKNGLALSFVVHDERKTRTQNFPVEDGLAEISRQLSRGGTAWLETAGRNFQLIAPPGARARLVEHQAAKKSVPPSRTHDREKERKLDGANNWLFELELTDARGNPKAGRGDKLRQIERYADLLAHFASDCGWKAGDKITLADMGCGKGYLTFAAWHLLRGKLQLDAEIIGVDAQPELVAACERAAKKTGAEKISFHTGKIEDADLPPLDALIALHACNDATDFALLRGVAAGAKLIVVAPCCHKDVRRSLGSPEPLAPVLEHGIFRERFAEWLTDGLRVLALEAAGYRVKTAEFVDAEHTPKNLLIGAIRGNSEERRREAAGQLAAIKTWAGTGPLPLDQIVH